MRFTIGDELIRRGNWKMKFPLPGFSRLPILFFSFLALSPVAAENFKVATVDMRTLFKEYPDTSRAQKKFEDLAREKERDLDDSNEALEDIRTQLAKSKNPLSRAERRRKEKELEEAIQDYEDEKNRIQNEMDERNQEMTRILTGRIREVVARIAKKEGWDLVLDSNDAVCAKFGTDLTGEVLRAFAESKPENKDFDSDVP
jgi:outer membrane protein